MFSASHSKGAVFIDVCDQVTDELKASVEQIIDGLPDFYYGRMDVKFPNIESLREGEGLEVIEVNGASSESIHIWDKNTKFSDAVDTLRWQYRTLFEIGAFHRSRGIPVPSIKQFFTAWKKDRELKQFFPSTD